MATLREALERVGREYPNAKKETFAGHPTAHYVRHELANAIRTALRGLVDRYKVKASPGPNQWSTIPWGAILDPSITTTPQKGFYVVYLFSDKEPIVHLSLNQGAREILDDFKSKAFKILTDRATFMRSALPEFHSQLNVHEIAFSSNIDLPRGYAAGHALGIDYDLKNLPNNDILENDLRMLLEAYGTLEFRCGDKFDKDFTSPDEDDPEARPPSQSVEETRKYKLHRRIDRRSAAATKAKKHHGSVCMACDMTFEEVYGELGAGFIEAHHKVPLSELTEGVAREYDIEKDFAVLCSNCHRMIHRMDDPSDVEGLRELLRLHRKTDEEP
ncbi:DUF3578 domain-containing protein [Terasakiella sp. SH-1]|uniref:MrcB family domain-containing protein n=1 Tax=Terasakiella sp. SH-1 TaxID=2560057 RepID=UPI0010745FDC|nr:DUF3578 domain-containing protein [Terasakiella sp. SH-1]